MLCSSLIEECPDEDPRKMKSKVCYVKLDALAGHVGKKVAQRRLSTCCRDN